MKLMLVILLGLGFIFIYSMCKPTEAYTPETFDKRKITFGSGGGFTGGVNDYCLLENGQLFGRSSYPSSSGWQPVDTLEKSQVKQYFNQIETLNLLKINHNRPGNWSYFITIEDGAKEHKIQWCAEAPVPQAVVLTFYDLLNENVKSLPPVKPDNPVR